MLLPSGRLVDGLGMHRMAPIVTGYIVQGTGSFASGFVLAGVLALVGAAVSGLMTCHPLGDAPATAAAH